MPLEALGGSRGEYLEVWSEMQTIVGRSTGMRWTLGDELKVRMVRVDLPNRQINYELAERPSPPKRRESGKSVKDNKRRNRPGAGGKAGRRKVKKAKTKRRR